MNKCKILDKQMNNIVGQVSTDINTALQSAETTINATVSAATNVMTGVGNIFNLVSSLQNKFTGVDQCEQYTKQTVEGITKIQSVLDQQNKAFDQSLKSAQSTLDLYQNEAGQLLLKQNQQIDTLNQNTLAIAQQQQYAEQYKNQLTLVNSKMDEDKKQLDSVMSQLNSCNQVFSYQAQLLIGLLLFVVSVAIAYAVTPSKQKKEQFSQKKILTKHHNEHKLSKGSLHQQHSCPC